MEPAQPAIYNFVRVSVVVERVAPVFPVRDVARARDRYQRPGFQLKAYVEAGMSSKVSPSYGYLRWGQVEIRLSGFDTLDPKTTTSVCYLFVDDADALYEVWAKVAFEGRLRPPADNPMREARVRLRRSGRQPAPDRSDLKK